MKKIFLVLLNLLVIVMLLGGCTGFSGRLDNDYGNSHRLAIANQTLNPEAEKNLEPVYGIDGNRSTIIIKRFRESFTESPCKLKSPLVLKQ